MFKLARPPELPIRGEEDYFQKLVKEINPYLQSLNIELNFKGYKNTVKEYGEVDSKDYNKLWELSRDFNMWGEYFINMQAVIEKLYLDAEVTEKEVFAIASETADVKSVNRGDRFANREASVVETRKNKNSLKAFLKVIESKIDFSYKCHHHCKSTCNCLKLPNSNFS
ncbi:hypothetical protein ACF13V_002047 [Clostridioides difficile]